MHLIKHNILFLFVFLTCAASPACSRCPGSGSIDDAGGAGPVGATKPRQGATQAQTGAVSGGAAADGAPQAPVTVGAAQAPVTDGGRVASDATARTPSDGGAINEDDAADEKVDRQIDAEEKREELEAERDEERAEREDAKEEERELEREAREEEADERESEREEERDADEEEKKPGR